jgi:phosphoglycolate phosphatase
VLTGGAGARAMARAFHESFGVDRAFEGIPMAGRTDDLIVADALARAGLAAEERRLAAFRSRYAACLAAELQRPAPGARVMPGIVPLLEALAVRPDVLLGLLTGNYPETARLKLEHFHLWHYFACGAYGGDAAGRNALVPVAIHRAAARGFHVAAPSDVYVVGDTPLDVACARAAGARAIAVATGSSNTDTLKRAGADVVLPDLSATDRFLALFG